MVNDHIVFIGKKPFMNYITAVVMQFNAGNKEVTVKARGKFISRAVDVVEVIRNRFLKDVKLKGINISSEEFKTEKGGSARTSIIELIMEK